MGLTSRVLLALTTSEDAMGREKANKPRKPRNETPRIVDMVSACV